MQGKHTHTHAHTHVRTHGHTQQQACWAPSSTYQTLQHTKLILSHWVRVEKSLTTFLSLVLNSHGRGASILDPYEDRAEPWPSLWGSESSVSTAELNHTVGLYHPLRESLSHFLDFLLQQITMRATKKHTTKGKNKVISTRPCHFECLPAKFVSSWQSICRANPEKNHYTMALFPGPEIREPQMTFLHCPSVWDLHFTSSAVR